MQRRTFLKLSATGFGIGLVPMVGCAEGEASSVVSSGQALVLVDFSGNRYTLEPSKHLLTIHPAAGGAPVAIGGLGGAPGQLNYPVALAFDARGLVHVVERGNHRVQVFETSGRLVRVIGSHGSGDGQLAYPSGIAIDAGGRILVSDTLNHRVAQFDSNGDWAGSFGAGLTPALQAPRGIAIAADGAIHVVDAGSARVAVYSPLGRPLSTYGHRGTDAEGMVAARSIAIDGRSRIYVGDLATSGFLVFDAGGNFIERRALRLDGKPAAPVSLALAPDGDLYISAMAAA